MKEVILFITIFGKQLKKQALLGSIPDFTWCVEKYFFEWFEYLSLR
jgi:hypothetical protein